MIQTSHAISGQQDKLTAQLIEGFSNLKFSSELEPDFQCYQGMLIKRRLPMVAVFSLFLLVMYALVDFLFLPDNVWQFTISIRLGMLIPVVLLALIMIRWMQRWKTIVLTTCSSYLWMGFGIIAIIAGAQLEGYDLPYDGLYSVLLFGFFLLGLPFRQAITSSWGLWLLYGVVEVLIGHTEDLLSQLFFIASMGIIGTVGCYLQEHTLRTGYLKHQLVKLSRQQAINDTQAKTQFLAAAGHDLRQPINAINLITDALLHANDKSNQSMLTERLSTSVDMLNRLLDSLLEYSRLEMGAVTPYEETVSIDALMTDLCQTVQPQLTNANITLETHINSHAYITTDSLLFERVVSNLINNVIRHSKASCLTVYCQLSPQPDKKSSGYLSVIIQDNGQGIAEEHLSMIFDEYYQVVPNREEGMGLGLSIVQQLTALLNINLRVNSEPNKGSSFCLEFQQIPILDTDIKPPEKAEHV